MDIKLSIDVSEIAKSAERALFEEAKRRTEGMTRNLFRSKAERNQFPHFTRDNPDCGFLYDELDSILGDATFEDRWREYAKAEIDRKFKAALDEALDTAIKHHANKIAFTQVNKKD